MQALSPKRSAMDLVTSLTHDLELDVQGAFDALLANRLLQRMQLQDWPLATIRLIESFLTGRRVRARLEDCTTVFYDVECGTPQGSPLSPVTYMLYLAELLQQDCQLRFGYAVDIALYRISNSLAQNIKLLQRDVEEVISWGEDNKVFFAPEKMDMIHFHTGRGIDAPILQVREDLAIVPITTVPKAGQQFALRWLGMWFGRKLRFRRHVAERVSKARHVARHIRNLARTKDGPPAKSSCDMRSLLCVIRIRSMVRRQDETSSDGPPRQEVEHENWRSPQASSKCNNTCCQRSPSSLKNDTHHGPSQRLGTTIC